MSKRKRFIASATCPECQAMDTMALYKENDVEKVECVQCGHTLAAPKEAVAAATRQFEQVIGVFKPGE